MATAVPGELTQLFAIKAVLTEASTIQKPLCPHHSEARCPQMPGSIMAKAVPGELTQLFAIKAVLTEASTIHGAVRDSGDVGQDPTRSCGRS